jgi:hypothetical protein
MFNFFKRYSADNNNLAFQNTFDRRQKAAIVSILIIVATCDGGINSKEEANIENTAALLGLSLSDSLLKELPALGRQNLINILNALAKGQKEWVLIAIYELVHCDGRPVQIEINYSAGIAGDLGFSEDQYLSLIEKTMQLRNKHSQLKDPQRETRNQVNRPYYGTIKNIRTDGYYLLKESDYVYVYAYLKNGEVAWFSEFILKDVDTTLGGRIFLAKHIHETIANPKVWANHTSIEGNEIVSVFKIGDDIKILRSKLKSNGLLQVFKIYTDLRGEKITEWYDYDFVEYGSY